MIVNQRQSPAGSLPLQQIEDNPHLVSAITDLGGHVGFVTGRSPLRPTFWAEQQAARFVASHLT